MTTFLFSAEEINLMCIFDTGDRSNLIKELRESLNDIYEPEMREIYASAIEKLGNISDEVFPEIGLYIADEYIDGEEYDIAD
jgi:hypothetical protein